MKCGFRFALGAGILLVIVLLFLNNDLRDLFEQYRVRLYVWSSMEKYLTLQEPQHQEPIGAIHGDKVIVIAKLEKEYTSWVAQELPDWQRAIYTVNPSTLTRLTSAHTLTTSLNKGHESMAYLTYIIDHYEQLPSTIVFLHAHRRGFFEAWHVDTPLHDNVVAVRSLQLPFVQQNGYVNLRCNWNPGCKKAHRRNAHVTRDVWQEVFEDTSTPPGNATDSQTYLYGLSAEQKEKLLYMPAEVGAACCAQFAVSRDQVLTRPLKDYKKFRRWITDTKKDDAKSGRVMEYLWHVIFGKEAVYCPNEEVCYCEVYGRC